MPTLTVTRTYLEMRSPADLTPAGEAQPGVRLECMTGCPWHFYRYLYTEIGRSSGWHDRLPWTEAQFSEWLAGPSVLWLLTVGGVPAGFFELRTQPDDSVEIAYFGLMQEFQARGLGKYLLTRAVQAAWTQNPRRVWLHTCTLDHPGALPNYLKRGFNVVREERYEVVQE